MILAPDALLDADGARRGAVRIEDGAVAEVLALPSEPAAFEEFWAE